MLRLAGSWATLGFGFGRPNGSDFGLDDVSAGSGRELLVVLKSNNFFFGLGDSRLDWRLGHGSGALKGGLGATSIGSDRGSLKVSSVGENTAGDSVSSEIELDVLLKARPVGDVFKSEALLCWFWYRGKVPEGGHGKEALFGRL